MELTDRISIYFQDRMKLMATLEDKSIDVSIQDPEYGIKEAKKNHKSRNTPVMQKNGKALKIKSNEYGNSDWDNSVPPDEYFEETIRVSKNQIFFGANYFKQFTRPQKPPRRNEYEKFLKEHPKGWIIWDKMNGSNDFSDCEVIYTSFDFDSYVFYYMWNGMMQGIYLSPNPKEASIQIGNKKLNEKRNHPTHKPTIVYRYLIEQFVGRGKTILDTGIGGGSLAIAIHDQGGNNLIGCENNKINYDKAIKRIKSHISQLKISFNE